MFFYQMIVLLFFFVKQKTAYEMRISDWSSDVCSSDLAEQAMEGVIAELSAALYLVDIDFTLHAEIIEEMITGESERPAEEIDEDVTEIASLAHAKETGRAHVCTPVTNAHLVCRHLLEKQNKPLNSSPK